MNLLHLVPVLLSILGITVAMVLAMYAGKRGSVPGVIFFALYMLSAAVWALGGLFGVVAKTIAPLLLMPAITGPLTALLFLIASFLQSVGYLVMPAMWAVFAVKYTGRARWMKNPHLIVWFSIPGILVLFSLVGDAYLWITSMQSLAISPWMQQALTIGNQINVVYVTLALVGGSWFIGQELMQAPRVYRPQYAILTTSGLAPWIFGLLATWQIIPFSNEVILLAIVAGALVGAWGMFRYQVFDIVTIAIDTVIASITDGVIVLDALDRVVSLNPAAQFITGAEPRQAEAQRIDRAFGDWPELIRAIGHIGEAHHRGFAPGGKGTAVASTRRAPHKTRWGFGVRKPAVEEETTNNLPASEVVRATKAGSSAAAPGGAADPEFHTYDVRVTTLPGPRDTPAGRLVLLRDITVRKEAEAQRDAMFAALKGSEARYRLLVENAPLGIFSTDDAGSVIDINRASLALLGFARDQALHDLNVLTYPPLIEAGISNMARLCLGGEATTSEHPYTSAAGQHVHLRLHLTPIMDDDVRVRGVQGIAEDITERQEMEAALRQSEGRLKVAMAAANLALWDKDLVSNELVVAHPGMGEQEWGYHTGRDQFSWEQSIHPDDWGRVEAAMAAHLSGETPVYEVEFRTLAPDALHNEIPALAPGSAATIEDWTWWLQRGQVVARDRRGAPLRVTGIQENVSPRKRAERELREAKEAAEAASRAKSAFLANMSHELRTPLNAILGFAQLMDRDPRLPADQRESLGTIRQSGEHLLTLINDVLAVSKIEAGQTTLQVRAFDLSRLLADVESFFRLRASEKDLQLMIERVGDVPQHIRTDEGKLRQVLLNLLSNAIKFTHEGGVTVRVRHATQATVEPASGNGGSHPQRERIIFEVEDTGIGIHAEDITRLFDPFVQSEIRADPDQIVSHEGTGLGLTISRHFVELMGGEIGVESEPGRGSIFRFDILVEVAGAEEVVVPVAQRRVVGLEHDQPVFRLLVVEDRETNRQLLVKLLTSLGRPPHGFEVRTASNGREALELWEEWSPHLIWMDMRMPVMDGYEATQRIKATAKGQATVIIALTASAFEEDRALILSQGCDDFVSKPFREAEIFSRLATHLGVRFLYEERPGPRSAAGAAGGDGDGRPERTAVALQTGIALQAALLALPNDWRDALYRAAEQADADMVIDLVQEAQGRGALAESEAHALIALVQSFRFDRLMALAEPQGG